MTRILIADDQPNVRYALRILLQSQTDWLIVAEAGDADELLAQVKATLPALLIVDWLLPGLDEDDFLPILRKIAPGLRVIAISGRPEVGIDALAKGVDAFISKFDPPGRLLAEIAALVETGVK